MQIGNYTLDQPQNGRVMITRDDGSVAFVSEASLVQGVMDALDSFDATEETQYWVKLIYNTMATDAKDALNTALAAIDARSAAYVEVGRDDAEEHIELEGELGLIKLPRQTGYADCEAGIHSWCDASPTVKLPADTECDLCGETYGDPK